MTYDLVVIGSGPGGYVCAIRAAEIGLSVAVVEKDATLGGTCLNVGCIPSKALLHTSELFEKVGHDFRAFGIEVGAPKLNLSAMMAHKDGVVESNTSGVAYLFKKNKIDWLRGTGAIAAPGRIRVMAPDGTASEVEAKAIVIATGSESTPLPGVTVDEKRIVSSTGALSLPAVPKRLVVVGAGVIGLELGSVWRRLGSEVTVVEFLDRILPGMDGEVAKQAQRILARQGIAFRLSSKVASVDAAGDGLKVAVAPAAGGDVEMLEADIVLVAIGRRPFTAGLGLEEAGVALDERRRVVVDEHFRTNVEGVYAIGDVVRGPMLAHKAEDEGVAVAEIIAGDRLGRKDRGGAEGRGDRIPRRKVPVLGECPGPRDAGKGRFRQGSRRRFNRPCARRPHRRPLCGRVDRRGLGADGVRRLGGGSRPHLPRPSDLVGGGEGSGARRLVQADPHLSRQRTTCIAVPYAAA
jgi:dihydrolipoamide dehydrogenase